MKKTELKSLIREIVEEQRIGYEMQMIHEDSNKFIAGKVLGVVLKPLITMAMRENPHLQKEFAQKFKSPEDLAAVFQDSKTQAQAKKEEMELSSSISEGEGGAGDSAEKVKSIFNSAKSKFNKHLNAGTLIALIAAVAWLVTTAYISHKEGGWQTGFGLAPKVLGLFGKNPHDDYRALANIIWGIIFAMGTTYSKGQVDKADARSKN